MSVLWLGYQLEEVILYIHVSDLQKMSPSISLGHFVSSSHQLSLLSSQRMQSNDNDIKQNIITKAICWKKK